MKPTSWDARSGNEFMDRWYRLKYFNQSENWGNPYKMDEGLLFQLDYFREILGLPVVINYGTQGKHSKNSSHYDGEAVDIVILNCKLHPLDILFLALRAGFSGIGYYPHWTHNGEVVGGWHLDSAPNRKALWLGVMEKGEQVYKKLNHSNLKEFKII